MAASVEKARRRYAEELRFTAGLRSHAVIHAFATVPREDFVGPGPWRVLSPMALGEYWPTEDADPRHLYHDVLIAIDEERRLNNGQPSLWARMYDQLQLREGAHVVISAPAPVTIALSLPRSSAAPDRSLRSRSIPPLLPAPATTLRPGPKRPP